MPFTIHKLNSGLVEVLSGNLKQGSPSDHLIVVSTRHDKRLLQSELAKRSGGLTPKVEVLTHQMATWLKYGVEAGVSLVFLTPRERRLALDRWNADHSLGYREAQLDHMHRVVSWMYRHGEGPEGLPATFGDLGEAIRQFNSWCSGRSWVDRASLFQWADRVPSHAFDHDHIHLVALGALSRQNALALDALMEHGGSSRNWHVYRPAGKGFETGLRADSPDFEDGAPSETKKALILKGTHPRNEVEQVFRVLKKQVVDSTSRLGFGDAVVILAQYDHYRPIVEMMSDRFELPVSFTRGASVLGDPAVSRLRTWLYLDVNGFLLDDVLQVFGDGAIPLASDVHGESVSPNLRTFSRFCKQFNIRSVDQLGKELERAIEREVRNRNDGIRRRGGQPDVEPSDFEQRHGVYYKAILAEMHRLRAHYPQGAQPVSQWYRWVKSRVDALGTLKSAELMAGLDRLQRAADTGLAMVDRIGYDPVVDGRAFSTAFDALLEGSLPVSQHPGRVLVGSVDDLTCLDGKRVFLVGLSDAGFPNAERSEELFAHLDEQILGWVRARERDPLEQAACWLASVAASSDALYLSYSSDEASHQRMPSVFLTDTPLFLPWLLTESYVPGHDHRCFDRMDWMMYHRTLPWDPQKDRMDSTDIGALSRHVSAVTRLRESPNGMSVWEGMLTDVKPEWAGTAGEVLAEALDLLKVDGQLKLSVSQLDLFAQSPLEYFFRRLLRLEAPVEYVDEAETNRKGTLLHLILDRFYSDSVRYGHLVDPVRDTDAALERILRIVEEVIAEHPEDLGNVDTPFPELLKKQLRSSAASFIHKESEGHQQFAPSVAIGLRPETMRNPSAKVTEVPFNYELDVDGHSVAVHGFIDRVDTSEDGAEQIIYDYKTGGLSSIKSFDQVNGGVSFQLPVYLKARHKEVGRLLAGYYHIPLSKGGKGILLKGMLGDRSMTSLDASKLKHKNNHGLLKRDDMEELLRRIQDRRIKPIVRLIRSGRYHQSLTKPSEYSDFKRMSRWSEAVSELRKMTLTQSFDPLESMLEKYYVEVPVVAAETESTTN